MTVFLILVSVFCFAYYLIIILYAGFQAAFSMFWPVAGGALLLWTFLRTYLRTHPGVFILPLWLKVSAATTFFAGVLVFVIVALFITTNMLTNPDEDFDYVIVLGAKLHGERVSKSLQLRLDQALEYYEAHPDTIIIVSGGQGKDEAISEAEAMRKYLVDHGVPRTSIRQEVRSVNTAQNLEFSKFFVKDSGSVGIITSDFHVFRAKAIAIGHGYQNVSGIPAKSDSVLILNLLVREVFAVLKDKFMGNI